jgi:hypothetical protein
MEKGNGTSTGGGATTTNGGAGGTGGTPAGGTSTDPGTGTGTEPAPSDQGGGGGSQADQEREQKDTRPSGEIINPDGSRLKINADGSWEYTDPSGQQGLALPNTGMYLDPATGEPLGSEFHDGAPPPPMGSFDQAMESFRNWARAKGLPVSDSFF